MSEDQKNDQTDDSVDSGAAGTDDVGISDDQLPDDLQPTDENPLAKPPSDDDEDSGMNVNPDGADGAAGMGT